jgi:hypothetical protein
MGFRSTFVSQAYPVDWPDWFREKYRGTIHVPDGFGCLASLTECKLYGQWADLAEDVRRAVDWDRFGQHPLVLAFLHECGSVVRCEVSRDAVRYTAPGGWEGADNALACHWYCYGCSDAGRVIRPNLSN